MYGRSLRISNRETLGRSLRIRVIIHGMAAAFEFTVGRLWVAAIELERSKGLAAADELAVGKTLGRSL
jgi:hypothetical protein